jgi:NO-binding membrane sensor protein with MHYT domain
VCSSDLLVSVVVAAIIAGLGLLIPYLGIGTYVESYWPTIVLVYAVAQMLYTGQKAATQKIGPIIKE